MHALATFACLALLSVAQARPGSYRLEQRAPDFAPTRIDYAAAACTSPIINPSPAGAQCDIAGSLRNKALLNRITIEVRIKNPVNSCALMCLGNAHRCQSFSYDTNYRICTTYFRTLAQQEVVPSNSSATYYDRGCYSASCPTTQPTPAPTPTHLPASTCRPLNRLTPLPGSFCNNNYITLTKPDIIGHASPDGCELACLNRASCKSWSGDGNTDTCNLYGKTISQQGPQNLTESPNIIYFDKGCEYKTCTQCYPPKPTTTFSQTSSSSICTPTITTQLVQNPSFEDNADGAPWIFSEGVSVVQNDPSNAFKGQNYVKYVGTTSTSVTSSNQTLENLTPGSDYRLRYALRHAENDNAAYCTFTAYADAIALDTVYFQHPADSTATNPAYYQQYANFSPRLSSSTLTFELTCYAYTSPVTLYLDNVEVVPVAAVCSFNLQTTSIDPRYNGLYLSSDSYDFILGDRVVTLVSNSSQADVFGIDPFGFLVDSSYKSMYLYGPGSQGYELFQTALGSYGPYGQILCQVQADQSLSCVNPVADSHAFRWCSTCLEDTIGDGLFFLERENPAYFACTSIGLNALYV